MKTLLILDRVQVQNANAIAGLTWGFPGITNFLGFTHALSRFLKDQHHVELGGCAVICHDFQVQAYQTAGYGSYVFAQTRNPLNAKGETMPFNEEGRMHLTVSLVIECHFSIDELDLGAGTETERLTLLEQQVKEKAVTQRLAGGSILDVEQVAVLPLPVDARDRQTAVRKVMFGMLPGFVLVERPELLAQHYAARKERDPELELVDAWLDFSALKYRAQQPDEEAEDGTEAAVEWQRVPKPAGGWLVPISTGYRAVSPLHEPGTVPHSRDPQAPFRFVEAIYSVGEWISPHRIRDIEQAFWRYQRDGDWYLCKNTYQP